MYRYLHTCMYVCHVTCVHVCAPVQSFDPCSKFKKDPCSKLKKKIYSFECIRNQIFTRANLNIYFWTCYPYSTCNCNLLEWYTLQYCIQVRHTYVYTCTACVLVHVPVHTWMYMYGDKMGPFETKYESMKKVLLIFTEMGAISDGLATFIDIAEHV